jgi:hypothetical protein
LALVTFRFVVKPLLPTLVFWEVLPPESTGWQTAGTIGGIFIALNLALNSRLGRMAEEMLIDGIVEGWHRFGLRFLAGLFWWVIDLFRRHLELIERLLYTVDEWLRFKSGENRLTLVAKGALGVVWFYVAYVVRFCVNLLIEPQVNPIKHIPVVTVSHKFIAPMSPALFHFLETKMDATAAAALTFVIITGTPGIFGFLVWELKENWRLFAANRPKGLKPVHIGLHGETMPRLLKPGFHSGTVPKRFAKLRRAERRALADGDAKAAHKHRDALRHIELGLRRYVEREFVELFAESHGWQTALPSVGDIHMATNRIRVAILLPGINESPLAITFDMAAGWMLSSISGESCAARLSPAAQHVLRTALIGLYKTGGVDLVRQQIAAAFSLPPPRYDLTTQGLVVWPDSPREGQAFYDLGNGQQIVPQILSGFPRRTLPTIDRGQLVFGQIEVAWDTWIAAWEQDQVGGGPSKQDFWSTVPAI